MKVFTISPGPPPNIKNFVINHPFFQSARLINGKYHVSLRFKGSTSAHMMADTEQAAFAEAYSNIIQEELLDKRHDPRLVVDSGRDIGTTAVVTLTNGQRQWVCSFDNTGGRAQYHNALCAAIANVYAAVDAEERAVKAVTARLSN